MKVSIITSYQTYKHNSSNGCLELDFGNIKPDTISLNMEVKGAPKNAETIWNIYSNGQVLDADDLTKGRKAELLMSREYAGTPLNPHTFTISVSRKKGEDVEKLEEFDIKVFENPKITKAYWIDESGEPIRKVSVNAPFTVHFEGSGIYKTPLHLTCYLKSREGNDLQIPAFSRCIQIDYEYGFGYLYINAEMLKNNLKFILGEAYRNLSLRQFLEQIIFSKPGDAPHLKIVQAYFQISLNNVVLFNGKNTKDLDIVIDLGTLKSIKSPAEISFPLSAVKIRNEEYFTQKYEPCKYEKIYFQYGKQSEEKIFDENEPTTKESNGSFKNNVVTISAIVPPSGSENIKELKIRLDGVDTEDCSLSGSNQKLTNSPDKNSKEHRGRVIDTEDLKEAEIEYVINEADKRITIVSSFNYKYDKDTAADFFMNYCIFSGMLGNAGADSMFKEALMGWEAKSKGIIDMHRIGLNTCRYKKGLYLKTYADVAWAFHALLDEPDIPQFYLDNDDIVTVVGLDEELDQIKDDPIFNNIVAPILSPALQVPLIRNFMFKIIKDIAEKYEFGLTAYYDFDSEDKNNKQIDYAETHPEFFKALIAGFTTLEILIDVLLIILTEGAALANFTSKAAKATKALKIKRKADRIVRIGRQADYILGTYSNVFSMAKGAQFGKSIFEMMRGSYFRGYRFVEDKELGIQPLFEERVKISPLINLGVVQKKSLGALLLDQTPIGSTFNIVINFTGGFQVGASGLFISKLGQKGKNAVGWARAITYPFKVVNGAATATYELLAFATDETVKNIFGAEAEFEKVISAHMDLDFWLKIQNSKNRIQLQNFSKEKDPNQVVTDKSSVSIAPSGAFTVRLKLSGSIADKGILVRAMNVLTWRNSEEEVTEFSATGKFEVKGNVLIERRYTYGAEQKPYYQDRVVFTGLGGEYMYKIKTEEQGYESSGKKKVKKIKEQEEIRQFMLLAPFEIGLNPSEMIKILSEK